MMLWDIIRDWFVVYIWGGTSSSADIYGGFIGNFCTPENFDYFYEDSVGFMVPIGLSVSGETDHFVTYLSFGDWLSTTSTIIVLALMCVFLFLCVRYLFRLTSGLLMGH